MHAIHVSLLIVEAFVFLLAPTLWFFPYGFLMFVLQGGLLTIYSFAAALGLVSLWVYLGVYQNRRFFDLPRWLIWGVTLGVVACISTWLTPSLRNFGVIATAPIIPLMHLVLRNQFSLTLRSSGTAQKRAAP